MTERDHNRFTDEEIMAYVDGALGDHQDDSQDDSQDDALDPATADRLRRRLATDAALADRVARFAQSRDALRRAHGDHPTGPVPAELLAVLSPPAHGAGKAGPAGRRPGTRRMLALAASAALVLLAGGYGVGRWHAASVGPSAVDMQTAIDDARQHGLETQPNNQIHAVVLPGGGQARVRPLLTFIDGQGRFCRSYEMTLSAGGDETLARGAACRDQSGDWRPSSVVPPNFTSANDT